MKTITETTGIVIVLILLLIESVIKALSVLTFCPIAFIAALLYPIIGKTKIIFFLEKWKKYTFTWKKGFVAGKVLKYWIFK
jgi:uncharacterized membrane protein